MGPNAANFEELKQLLPEIQSTMAESGLAGWLLYDLHARNMVAGKLLGMGELTRRFFVLLPARGEPVALIHGIEQAPWACWPWQRRVYVGWRELAEKLRSLLGGHGRFAMEVSERDAVPALDLVPSGVVELVRETGADVVSSGELITRFYSRWRPDDLASHRRAAAVLAQVAHAVMLRLAHAVGAGEWIGEGEVRDWVLADLARHGVATEADCIVARGINAADPHYAVADGGSVFEPADLVLLDLWAKESTDSVFADQTWMGYLGAAVPERAAKLFSIIRDARDAAVDFVSRAFEDGRTVRGGEVDDIARNLITDRGYGAFFIHRTGHSIDRDVHGMGPNIDNLETREVRTLVPGVAFSIEPGIYIPGDVGLRTEINVHIGESGPEVTTPGPQREILTLLQP